MNNIIQSNQEEITNIIDNNIDLSIDDIIVKVKEFVTNIYGNTKSDISGYLYCLYNVMYEHHGKNVYKLGQTGNTQRRINSYRTPYYEKPIYKHISKKVRNKCLAELVLFDKLKKYRMINSREFFKCDLELIKKTIDEVCELFDKYTDTEICKNNSLIFNLSNIDKLCKEIYFTKKNDVTSLIQIYDDKYLDITNKCNTQKILDLIPDNQEKILCIKRMTILGIDKFNEIDTIDDFLKELVTDGQKFDTFIKYKHMVKNETEKNIMAQFHFLESIPDNFCKKLEFYKIITSELGIKDNIKFNYYEDKVRFDEKITNKDILDKIPEIIKLFRFVKTGFDGIHNNGGYKKLYNLAVKICKSIFGFNTFLKRKPYTIYKNKVKTTESGNICDLLFINKLNELIAL